MTYSEDGNKAGNIGEWIGVTQKVCFDDLPHRYVEFTCSCCGKVYPVHRWAFVEGSGVLEYFFDQRMVHPTPGIPWGIRKCQEQRKDQ